MNEDTLMSITLGGRLRIKNGALPVGQARKDEETYLLDGRT